MITFQPDDFRVPSRSGDPANSTCVEFACKDREVELRQNRNEWGSPEDHRLRFPAEDFALWVKGHNAGSTEGLCLSTVQRGDGLWEYRSTLPDADPAAVLVFDQDEVDAFLADVKSGKYNADLGIEPVSV